MNIPTINHTQYAVLKYVSGSEKSGSEIRKKLGIWNNTPAFYQFISRLENRELIVGRYNRENDIRIRSYMITGMGKKIIREVERFYKS